jgi:hypothetical protein
MRRGIPLKLGLFLKRAISNRKGHPLGPVKWGRTPGLPWADQEVRPTEMHLHSVKADG